MTITDPRLWNPSGPHIGPDDEDLAFLAPTGDAETDIGSVALAVHRTGAAACEAVMREPLPDEYRMIEALATARARLAPDAIETVSKAVTSVNYAALLLRDVFDDAERGALGVYTACVHKAVAPPLAVQRAGLVFGVPRDDLGQYMKIAANPAVHPVALADAADRAVLAWASRLASSECEQLVGKRSAVEWNATTVGREHPKDPGTGRFVDVLERPGFVAPTVGATAPAAPGFLARVRQSGFGGVAAPEVAAAPVTTEVVSPAPARPERKVRRVRRTRKVRQTSEPATQVQAQVRMSPNALRASLKSKVTARLGSEVRLDQQVQQAADDLDLTVDLGQQRRTDEIYRSLPEDTMLAFAMDAATAQALYDAAPENSSHEKFVVIGNLQDIWQDRPESWKSDSHTDQLREYADESRPPSDLAEAPVVQRIRMGELEQAGIDWTDARAVEAYAKAEGYYDQVSINQDGIMDPILKRWTSVAPSAAKTGDWYVVRSPRPGLYGDDAPPEPIAAEYVLASDYGDIRGRTEGVGRHVEFYLDPSQHYVFRNKQRLWSEEHNAWVDRYHLQPMDPDFPFAKATGRAVTVDQWNSTTEGKTHPKDAEGRWAAAPGFLARVQPRFAEPVTTPTQPLARRTRATRRTRRTASEQQPLQANVSTRIGANIPAEAKVRLHAAMQAVIEQEAKDLPTTPLDDQLRYKVFTAGEWQDIVNQLGYKGFADPGVADRLSLHGGAKRAVFERELLDLRDADAEMRVSVINEVTEQPSPLHKVTELGRKIDDTDESWLRFAHDIRGYMNTHPEVAYAQIEWNPKNSSYEVYVNRAKVTDRVLLIMPDDFDPDSQYVLRWIGYQPQSTLTRGISRSADDIQIDAKVQTYKVARARMHMWHVEEQ